MMPWAIRAAASTFPAGTGLGALCVRAAATHAFEDNKHQYLSTASCPSVCTELIQQARRLQLPPAFFSPHFLFVHCWTFLQHLSLIRRALLLDSNFASVATGAHRMRRLRRARPAHRVHQRGRTPRAIRDHRLDVANHELWRSYRRDPGWRRPSLGRRGPSARQESVFWPAKESLRPTGEFGRARRYK